MNDTSINDPLVKAAVGEDAVTKDTMKRNPESTRRFWSDQRLRRFSTALLLAVLLSLLIHLTLSTSSTSMLKEGDFPGFYSPAVTLYEGKPELLYDLEYQKSVQSRYWPDPDGGFYISVYPPYFCALLLPLALFPPLLSKALLTLAMLACFLSALKLASGSVAILRSHFFETAVMLFLFPPLFFGVLSAQNTALSLLLYSGALYFFQQNSRRGDFWAGVLLGLWLFKPQYGLPAMLLPLLGGRYRALWGSAAAAICYYFLGAAVLGLGWPIYWVSAATAFGDVNYGINGHQMLSYIGAFHALARFFPPGAAALLHGVALVLTLSTAAATAWAFLKPKSRQSSENAMLFPLLLMAPALLLINPQTLFYDLGIATISCIYSLKLKSDREVGVVLSIWLLCTLAALLRDYTAFPLLFFFSLASFVFVWRTCSASVISHEA